MSFPYLYKCCANFHLILKNHVILFLYIVKTRDSECSGAEWPFLVRAGAFFFVSGAGRIVADFSLEIIFNTKKKIILFIHTFIALYQILQI